MKKRRIKYYLLIGLTIVNLIFLDINTYAITYYISSSGNDRNSGLRENEPWQSLAKVNRFAFRPGDQILFKRGDEWTGTIKVNASGKAGSPIIFGAYGDGTKPVISGFTTLTNWTRERDSIYSKTIAIESKLPNLVLVDGVNTGMGRYPNTGIWLTFESHVDGVSITDDELTGIPDWTGAEAVIRKTKWSLERCKIIYHANSVIAFNEEGTSWNPINDYGYFIQNDLKTLDVANEWYYNGFKFYFYSNPSAKTVKISTINRLLVIYHKHYITVENISFKGANSHAIQNTSGQNIVIQNCTFENIGMTGIYTDVNSVNASLVIDNNTFNVSNNNAILLRGSNTYSWIKNNTISNIGLIHGSATNVSASVDRAYDAISIYGTNSITEYNSIVNIGHNGITMMRGHGLTTRNNYISNFGLTRYDAGGIYLWNVPEAAIRNNIIDVSNHISEGIAGSTDLALNGIYIDNDCSNIMVTGNTVHKCSGRGLYILNANKTTFSNNTSFNNDIQLGMTYAFGYGVDITGMSITNNNLIAKTSEQVVFRYRNDTSPLNMFGIADSNYYARLNDDDYKIQTQVDAVITNRTLTEWKKITGQDTNSTFDSIKLSKGETEKLFYNNTKQTTKYYLGKSIFRDIYGNNIIDTFLLEPYTSKIILGKDFENINRRPQISDQSFYFTSPKLQNDSIGQIFAIEADTAQMLKFSIVRGNELNLFSIDSLSGRIITANEINTSRDLLIDLIVRVTDNSVNPLSDSARVILNIEGKDFSPPTISSFSIPSSTTSYIIPIESFIASDDIEITGYLLTDNPAPPNPNDTSWTLSSPIFFSSSKEGELILFAWTKDAAGNISAPAIDNVIIAQAITQFIELEKGWNIFSTNLIPSNLNLEKVLENLLVQHKLIEIQDEAGNTYQQNDEGWTNNIGKMRVSEGYKIRVNSSCTLKIRGHPVNLPVNIQLHEGWNIISFPCYKNIDAMEVIQPLIDTGILEKVQDEMGNSIEYWDSLHGWINEIGDFNAGEGYVVKVNQNSALPILKIYEKSVVVSPGKSGLTHFRTIFGGNGFGHMNVNITGLKKSGIQVGDELAAYDEEKCVGAIKVSEIDLNNDFVSIQASSSDEDIINGFSEGHRIDLMVWQTNTNHEFRLHAELIKGNWIYEKHGSVFFQLPEKKSTETNEYKIKQFDIYPNPARSRVTLMFSTLPVKGTMIILSDITGKLLMKQEVKSLLENLDISSQPSGIYFIKILSKNNYKMEKLVINRF